MVTINGFVFEKMEGFWSNLRSFSYRNRTVLEILFIGLYSIEQIGLVWSTFFFKQSEVLTLIVSLFAIIVLTTFSLHKLVMESRIKVLEKNIESIHEEKSILESKARLLSSKYSEVEKKTIKLK